MACRSAIAICLTLLGLVFVTTEAACSTNTEKIVESARRDGIDLLKLPFTAAALRSIEEIGKSNFSADFSSSSRVDVHAHTSPDFFNDLLRASAGNATPSWDLKSHLQFMANNSISHAIISIPGTGLFPGNAGYSAGLARLLNEWLARLVQAYPQRFSFLAVVPLPYVQESITEAAYALTTLQAKGVGLLTNHEGLYLGNPKFTPFFAALNETKGGPHVCMIHPGDPVLRLNGALVSANPTTAAVGLIEYYFETARTLMDLTISGTLSNFTQLRYSASHCGGSFPSIEDRFLKTMPSIETSSKEIYSSRFWYDSAGPTYFAQVRGLLDYGVPPSQLVLGTDYPFAPLVVYGPAIAAIANASFLTHGEIDSIFRQNAENLYNTRFI